jgi:hypothetical protein
VEKTFAKGLILLETLIAMEEPTSVTRLANALGLYKSNVHRLLRTLMAAGYVVQIDDGRYMPSLRMTEMGQTAWATLDLGRLAAPALTAIAAATGYPALLLLAERSALRLRAVAGGAGGAPLPDALALPGAARRLAELLHPATGVGGTLVLPLAGDDPAGRHLCMAPVPDLRLPAQLALALIAPDAATASGLDGTLRDLANGLPDRLTGSGLPQPGLMPVSA